MLGTLAVSLFYFMIVYEIISIKFSILQNFTLFICKTIINITNMKKFQAKTITFRLDSELYQKCVELTIKRSKKENRIVKLSEIIREAIHKGIKEM